MAGSRGVQDEGLVRVIVVCRGKPPTGLAAIVSLIGATTSTSGLCVRSEMDRRRYPAGVRVSDEHLARFAFQPHRFLGQWNYTVHPAS